MSYYRVLGFEREPFSTSPDPHFFYLSREHDSALTNTLIELRLKRGLTVILGDIGTGKTTLSRKLVHELRQRDDFIFYMMLNPYFETEERFLSSLLSHFEIVSGSGSNGMSIPEMMDRFERFLLQRAVKEGKTLTLILDEAQKVTNTTLETLRIFLNFETNEFKLLQVVLLGQLELIPKIIHMQNFYDRISLKYVLNPFDYEDTKKMILFRIAQAGYHSDSPILTDEAIDEISRYTMGYPRRITMMCHKVLKELVIQRKKTADQNMIKELIQREDHAVQAAAVQSRKMV